MDKKDSRVRINYPGRGHPKSSAIKSTPVSSKPAGKPRQPNRTPNRLHSHSSLQITPYLIVFLFIAIFICVAAPVIASGIAYISIQQSPRILPNVTSNGLPIGKKTVAEATYLIHQTSNLSHTIELTDQIVSQSVPINDLGISVDAVKTAETAYLLGRSGSVLTQIKTILEAYTAGISISPTIAIDMNRAQSGLEALSPVFSQPPSEAYFYLDNDQVKALQGKIGYTPNINDALTLIRADPENIFYSSKFVIPLQPALPAILDLSSFLPEAQRLIQTPGELIFYDPVLDEWLTESITKTTLLDWITISQTNTGNPIQLNPLKINEYVALINQKLSPGRSIDFNNASAMILETIMNQTHPVILIQHHPTTYIVQPGDTLLRIGWDLGFPYWQIVNANPSVDPNQIAPGTEITIPSKNDLLPLPIVLHKRIIISIDQQLLWVYEYGKQIQKFVISTGIDRSPTQPGIFQVQTHVRSAYASIWDLTMPNFLGIYEAWPGFMNGIHGLPTLSNGRILWANVLGQPASYGCIILNLNAAEWLYQWAEDGVVVEIRP